MKHIFKRALWKDIIILVVLLSEPFFRYTAFRDVRSILYTGFVLIGLVGIYATFYMLYNAKSNKQRLWMAVIYSISFLYMFDRDMLDVYIYLLIASIFIENRNKCLQTYFIASTCFISIAVICYFLKIIPEYNTVRDGSIRYSLGFVHPNTIFRYFFGNLMALYLLDKKKIWFNIYSIGMAVTLFMLTNSRTGIIATFIFVLISNFEIIFRKIFNKIDLRYAFLLTAIFSVSFVFIYCENSTLNEFFSGRPALLHDILVNAKWHILYGREYFKNCDNRTIYLIVRDGLPALLISASFYYFTFRKKVSNELKVVFLAVLIYGLTENIRSLGQDIVPLICMWSIYDNYIKLKFEKNDKNLQKIVNNDNI